jgi:nucleoside-diphosphate-sugar epimerase
MDIVFAPRRQGEQQESFLNVSKAREQLGWRAETALEEGLSKTYAWAEAEAMAQRT